MGDIQSKKGLWAKGILFVVLGSLASAILVARWGNLSVVVLHCVAIWAFCRAFYFAFYVIEHYADPGYRFAGLLDFVRYAAGSKRGRETPLDNGSDQTGSQPKP